MTVPGNTATISLNGPNCATEPGRATRLIVLGSGSRGNASLLTVNGVTVLIDAGLSPRKVHRACHALGVPMPSHILLTHPDTDHLYRTWSTFSNRGEVTLHLHEQHVGGALRLGFARTCMQPFTQKVNVGPVQAHAMLAAHDVSGTCVFRLQVGDSTLGWATDVGRFTDAIHTHLSGVDVLAIESNYDREMQEQSDRPHFLKARIMGGAGHLSNRQTLDAVLALHDECPLRSIVLLHLSQQCNCPIRLRQVWTDRAVHLVDRLVLTSQHEPVTVDCFSPVPN